MKPIPQTDPRLAALTLGAVLGLCCFAAGCGDREVGGAPPRHQAPPPPKFQAVEIQPEPLKPGVGAADESLAARVKARLASDPRLHGLAIDVDAQGGRITLWGKVERRADKAAAGDLARQTPGAASVANLIEIQPAPPR